MCAPSAASELWLEYIAAAFFSRVLFRWPFSADKAGRLAAPSLFLARVSGLALSSERQRWSEIESALFIILVKRQQKRLRPFSQVIAKTSPSAVPLHDIRIFNAFKWCFFFFVPTNFDRWSDRNAHRHQRSNQRSKSNRLPISLQWLDLEKEDNTGEVIAGETRIIWGISSPKWKVNVSNFMANETLRV